MRLGHRLLLAFVLVAAVAVGVVAILVGLSTTDRFERYTYDVRQTEAADAAGAIAEAYGRSGDLTAAAAAALPAAGARSIGLVVTDTAGRIVWGRLPAGPGAHMLADASLAAPIVVDDQSIGAVRLTSGMGPRSGGRGGPFQPGGHDALDQRFIDETIRSLWIGFGMAVGVALLLALLLSRSITRRLARLGSSARRFARGERDVRMGLSGSDEFGAVASAFDEMADALDAQETARRNLLADIAHELRTPLTVIEGNTQAMLDGVYERSDENLSTVLRRAQGLQRLVEDVRDLSLADVGQLTLDLADVSVDRVLDEVGQAMLQPARDKGLELTLDSAGPGRAWADPGRLRQVMVNLIDNAIRHTSAGGSVRVVASQTAADAIAIDVEDTGEGIAATDLPHVFDRFYRADAARPFTPSGGSGLGLAIVRALVTAMGGRVSVESRPGEGSRFRVELLAGSAADAGERA